MIMADKILIVEDESAQVELLRFNLERAGFEVMAVHDGWDALTAALRAPPALIILDWMLPELSGLDVCRELRSAPETQAIPILMVSARTREDDRARGLEHGADDYMIKPFSPRELIARVNALLRRSQGTLASDILQSGDITLDLATRQVKCGDILVHLGPRELQLLETLIRYPEHVFSRIQLIDKIWDIDGDIDARTIDVHISRLRRAFKRARASEDTSANKHNYIRAIRGAGYAFSPRKI